MTMHTKPLSPWAATLNPEAVRIFTVACAETFSGAALLANAISASGVIMYSLSGGYLALCPRTEATCRLTRRNTSAVIIFRIFELVSLVEILSQPALRLSMARRYALRVVTQDDPERTSLGYGLSSSAHRMSGALDS